MRFRPVLYACAAFGIALALVRCGDPTCIDLDGDGFGEGCGNADCDDTNASRTDNCDFVPPPDCDADPVATGCPCLGGVAECFGANPLSLGFPPCRSGRAVCTNGYWGLCNGAVLPGFETCEATDQDCDGRVDEGVRSPCGGCNPDCRGGVWGEGDAPFIPDDGAALTGDGELTLDRFETLSSTVWVANSAEHTLSRVDAESAMEVARYFTGGTQPSRVAVDWRGDAWVANREFDGVSSIRKIASDLERCIDRDGSTSIETSSDSTPLAEDECVLFTTEVGESGGVARALAIDGNIGPEGTRGGDVWLGLHDAEAIVHLDGETGAILERFETPGFQPYAAVFDAWGTLWIISRDGFLLSLDRFNAEPVIREVPLACFLLYGLDADEDGNLLLTGFACDRVTLYEPRFDRWSSITTPPSVRGAVVQEGDEGPIGWVAHTDGRVSRVSMRPLQLLDTVDLGGLGISPIEAIGVGIDDIGHFWAASSQGTDTGVLTRVDVDTLEVSAQVPLGLLPHTQGDLTGSKRAGGFVPEGSSSHVFEGCPDRTEWLRIHVAAELRGGGRVQVSARHAATRDGLASAAFVNLGELPDDESPFDLTFPIGGFVEVRLDLSVDDRDGAPRVSRVGLEWGCPEPI